jgi:hypothetical protein
LVILQQRCDSVEAISGVPVSGIRGWTDVEPRDADAAFLILDETRRRRGAWGVHNCGSFCVPLPCIHPALWKGNPPKFDRRSPKVLKTAAHAAYTLYKKQQHAPLIELHMQLPAKRFRSTTSGEAHNSPPGHRRRPQTSRGDGQRCGEVRMERRVATLKSSKRIALYALGGSPENALVSRTL